MNDSPPTQNLERVTVFRLGPVVGTWMLFFFAEALNDPDAWLAAPILVPALVLAVVSSIAAAFTGQPGTPTPSQATKVYVACQTGIYLLHFCLLRYAGVETNLFVIVGLYTLYCLWLNQRWPAAKTISGPALLFVAMSPGRDVPASQLYVFSVLLLFVSVIVVLQRRSLKEALFPGMAAFLILFSGSIERGVITLFISLAGIVVLYVMYRVVLSVVRLDQFTSLVIDVIAVPCIVLLATSVDKDAPKRVVAGYLLVFYSVKYVLLGVVLIASLLRDRTRAVDWAAVYRMPYGSKRATKYNNLWFASIGSACSVGLAFVYYLHHLEGPLGTELLLVFATALALYLFSRFYNDAFLATIHAAGAGKQRLRAGARFDARLLRLAALTAIIAGMAIALPRLDRASVTESLYERTAEYQKARDDRKLGEHIQSIGPLDAEVQKTELPNGELFVVFLVFTCGFGLLGFIADRELRGPPVFFLRGLVPLKGLLSARAAFEVSVNAASEAPIIGWFFKLVSAAMKSLFASFDGRAALSFGKMFIVVGVVLFAVGFEDALDRVLLVGAESVSGKFFEVNTASPPDIVKLSIWKTFVAYSILGTILFALGVFLKRRYLRSSAIVLTLTFLAAYWFRTEGMFVFFPFVCLSAVLGTFFLLYDPVASDEAEASVSRSPMIRA